MEITKPSKGLKPLEGCLFSPYSDPNHNPAFGKSFSFAYCFSSVSNSSRKRFHLSTFAIIHQFGGKKMESLEDAFSISQITTLAAVIIYPLFPLSSVAS